MRMSAREMEMAELLAKNHREDRLSSLVSSIDPDVSAVLDLGCGIGALTSRLAERFPSTLIVGIDKSKYLLGKIQKRSNVLTVLADIPAVPLKDHFFDVVVAVQVLHEIFHFKGAEALNGTFHAVARLLKNRGKFIILDHSSPGDAPISFKLSDELRTKLYEFQSKFRPRKITCYDEGNGWIKTSLRDFYDFATKIWALDSALEEEEMNETHTPFGAQELENLVQKAGFEVTDTTSLTSITRHLEYYGITVKNAITLPTRHILLKTMKTG